MANYNSKKIYNKKVPDGGIMYNSGPFTIIILDSGSGIDGIKNIFANIDISDTGIADENITLIASVEVLDKSISTNDNISITSNVNVSDNAIGNDILSIGVNLQVSDLGIGKDFISVADSFFVIDSHNILQPLGVKVTSDSRVDLLPSTFEKTEEIPGKHGEFYFGKDFKSRLLELHVKTKNGNSELEKLDLQRLFAKYLNPTKGPRKLVFADDINKTYLVKYNGKINFSEYATWFPFVIPFKMSNPYIMGSFENILAGSGIAVNDGNRETPLIITIIGPITNPTIQIGTFTLSYSGNIAVGEEVVIDTHLGTAFLNNTTNVLDNIVGEFPYYLPVGNSNVIADSKVISSWRSRWI